MNTKAIIAIPAQVDTVVEPKPKRSEVIDALTELKIQQLEAEAKRASAEAERLRPQIERGILKASRKVKACVSCGSQYGTDADPKIKYIEVRVDVAFDSLPEPLKAKLVRYHACSKARRMPDRREIRARIAAQSLPEQDRATRVEALLSDKASRAALEQLLKAIETK